MLFVVIYYLNVHCINIELNLWISSNRLIFWSYLEKKMWKMYNFYFFLSEKEPVMLYEQVRKCSIKLDDISMLLIF